MNIYAPHMGLSEESASGGDIADIEIMRAIADKGNTIHCALFGKRENKISHPNIIFYNLPLKTTFGIGTLIPNVLYFFHLRKLNKKNKIDIVRIYSQNYGYFGFLVKKILKIPIIWNYHHLENNFNERWQSRLFIKRFDGITVVSEATKKEIIEKYNVDSSKMEVVYNGVSERYRPMKQEAEFFREVQFAKKRILLFVGSLNPRKNLLFLINCFAQIRSSLNDVVLLICGNDKDPEKKYTKELTKLIDKLDIADDVHILSNVNNEEKIFLYNKCSVFVFPSLKEGFGLAPIEAMACGKPVVSSNLFALPEVVKDNVNGYAVSIENETEFVNKTLFLLENKQVYEKLSTQAPEFVRANFSWKKAADATLKFYEKIINKNNGI